ncbi:kinase-like protein [Pluteus cervinus]|uniref:Kinase-like protein n=1 Tax=Pluteus cervinus TaxID=181527 RepID=A0ACD3AL53_9AGAR|nr:kinase-like protein [Pluteus cervinus]
MVNHLNKMLYNVGVPAEEIDKYCPGGFHPIRLHDRLDSGRYEVLNKLGFGSFSTVWLARDHDTQTNVTIKIVVAGTSDALNREFQVLKHLKESGDSSHPGYKHVLHLRDSFHVDGPNGRHLCVVMDLLGPKISSITDRCINYRLNGQLARQVSQQLVLAVDYLHKTGVAHGDIHPGNVLFKLPDLDHLSPDELVKHFGEPTTGEVSRKDGQPLGAGVPEYLVLPVDHCPEDTKDVGEVQLIDFGESFLLDDPPPPIVHTPTSFHPPELVFRHAMSSAVDIWNLACTTFELVTGRTLFEAGFENRELIPQFKKVIGNLPQGWVADAIANNVLAEEPSGADAERIASSRLMLDFSLDEAAESFLRLEDELARSYIEGFDRDTLDLNESDLDTLGKCLRRMLVLDPCERATTEELITNTWFASVAGPASVSSL